MSESSVSRRRALVLGGRVAAAGVVGGLALNGAWNAVSPALASGGSKKTVRIGYLPITDAAALLTAHERGFLADQGITSPQPVLFRSWEALAQAFAIGEIDVAHLLMPLAVQLRIAKKVPLKVIGWGHVNGSALTVGNQITATEQLAGTTVAIPYWWSIHNVLLQRLLLASGLEPVIRQEPKVSDGSVQLAVMAPADMVPALAAGQVSGYVVADPFSAVAEAKGIGRVHRFLGDVWKEPLKVIGWGHVNGSALTVGNQITATEQLAGTTVAIPYWWSIHNVLLQRLLLASGLEPVIRQEPKVSDGSVQLAVMAPADMVPALAAGQVSGYVVADPFSAVAEAKGIGRVHRFLGDVWKEHACCAIVVREDLINDDPDTAQGIATAIVKAQQWIDGHRADMGGLLADGKYLPQPTPAVQKVFSRDAAAYAGVARHPDWHGERLGFSALPLASYTSALVDSMRTTTIDGDSAFLQGISGESVHKQLVDDHFVKQALGGGTIPASKLTRQELIEP